MAPELDRRALLEDSSARGVAFCGLLSQKVDAWLARLWDAAGGPDDRKSDNQAQLRVGVRRRGQLRGRGGDRAGPGDRGQRGAAGEEFFFF